MSDVDPVDEGPKRFPIIEERLRIEKQVVETGRVRITSKVLIEDVPVHEQLSSTSIRVERVPTNRLVDVVPTHRRERDRTIFFVTEEVLVKRIRVIEEVHLINVQRTDHEDRTVTLRRLDLKVERFGPPPIDDSVLDNSN